MNTVKKDKILDILTHWINTEFLTQELETRPGKPKAQVFSSFEDVEKQIDIISQEGNNKKTLITVTFGRINHKLFMDYFQKRHHKKLKIDFAEKAYFPFGKLFCLYDPKEKTRTYQVQYSPLIVTDWHLLNRGKITDLDTSCYSKYVKEHPSIQLIYKAEINRILRYCKQYIGNVEENIQKQSYSIWLEKKKGETCSLPPDITNFYIRDLEHLRLLVKEDKYGNTPYEDAVLRLILNESEEPNGSDRINISAANQENKEKVRELFLQNMNMAHAPMGKWESSYRPYLMQQLAVNMFCNSNTPIFTVNGPPGTGKTTLIKEVIADVITKKVKIMCDFLKAHNYDPDSFFQTDNKTGRYLYESYGLNDYSILIASSTNNAVNNIMSEFRDPMFMKMLGKKLNIRRYQESVREILGKETKNDLRPLIINYLKLYDKVEQMGRELETNQSAVINGILDKYYNESTYEEAQKSNPYVDDEFDRQRMALFALARNLHKQIAKNSNDVANYVGEDDNLNLDRYFFITPVIGTTFASVESMFSDSFGKDQKGQYGILIVDEAGQVLPQNAVGALVRSRKALIVGDPKQIPPVAPPAMVFAYEFTRPETAKKKLYTGQLTESILEDIETIPSLQKYADAINPYGTLIDDTWVGCPLVLHSRCISPMFEISNELSYNDTMINVTKDPSNEKADEFILDKSCWIQVRGREGGGEKNHFVRKQGDVVIKMIREKCMKLIDKEKECEKPDEETIKALNLFVISPFVSVSEGLKNYIRHYIKTEEKSNPENKSLALMKEWLKSRKTKSIGTIHTFQGEQADEVIFLLGCDSSSKSAANWIYRNMVNVAASRAKYRLYIVGDMNLWREKTDRKEESPVNRARRIIGNGTEMGLNEFNALLFNTRDIRTRREERRYICPVCGSDVIKRKNGWFCKSYKKCRLNFSIYYVDLSFTIHFVNLPSTTLKKLLVDKEDTWFRMKTEDGEAPKRVHLFPGKYTDINGQKYYDSNEFVEIDSDDWRPTYGSKLLLCNCSKMVQNLRKEKERDNINIGYFDIMILDAIYTIQYSMKKNVFSSYDVLKLLSGMEKPDNKSGLRSVIDDSIKRMMNNPLYEKSTNKNVLLPHLTIEAGNKTKIRYRINAEGRDGMKPLLFDFLNNPEEGMESSILKLPYPLIDGRKDGKTIFPNTEKWLKIKYYILYRISYMYKLKTTSHIISLTNMKETLLLDKEKYRLERKNFRDRLSDYLDFLKSENFINPDSHMINSTSPNEGYCGVKSIVINPVRPFP